MDNLPLDLNGLRLDEEGRVVLDDASLEMIATTYVWAGGVSNTGCHGHNNGACTNSDCGQSTNTDCTNSGGCNNTSNRRCDNHVVDSIE